MDLGEIEVAEALETVAAVLAEVAGAVEASEVVDSAAIAVVDLEASGEAACPT